MEIALISFSPTGGTLKCARLVAEGMGRIIKEIDLTDSAFDEADISSSTTALFAFPSYAGRLPLPLRERLGRIKGNGGDAVLVAVYGNRDIDDTLIEGADIVSKNGFRIKACVSAVAEHSLVRAYGKGRPDEEDARELSMFGKRIAMHDSYLQEFPGNRPYKESKRSGIVPITDKERCTSCSLCQRQCPTGAISIEDSSQVDSSKCISCTRCIVVCPRGAKHIDKEIIDNIDAMLSRVAAERKENALFL